MKDTLLTSAVSVLLNYALQDKYKDKEIDGVQMRCSLIRGNMFEYIASLPDNEYTIQYVFDNTHMVSGLMTINSKNAPPIRMSFRRIYQILRYAVDPSRYLDVFNFGPDYTIVLDLHYGKKKYLAITGKTRVEDTLFNLTNNVATSADLADMDQATVVALFMASGAAHLPHTKCQDVLRLAKGSTCHVIVYGTLIRQIISLEYHSKVNSGRIETMATDLHRNVDFTVTPTAVFDVKEQVSNTTQTSVYDAGRYTFSIADNRITLDSGKVFEVTIEDNDITFERIV